jgi:signal transduction histidine kinase
MSVSSQPNGGKGAPVRARREVRAPAPTSSGIRRLERAFASCEWRDQRLFARVRKRANARALEVLEHGGTDIDGGRTALLIASAEMFGALRVVLAASPREAARLADEFEEITGLSRIALGREVLRAPELLTLSPTVAVEAQLAMLAVFAPLRSTSLWILDDAGHVNCVRHVGEGAPSRGARELARRLLAGQSPEPSSRRLLLGLPVGRWQQPLAALVGSARAGMGGSSRLLLEEAVPMLRAILERQALLAGNAASERALVESSERKLTRLGFDLHDGPIQDVAVLAQDLHMFSGQLESFLDTPEQRALVSARMEDLHAQLQALDLELRRISNEVHAASALLTRPFARALRDIARAFAARTNIQPRLTLDGDMRLLSASQRIALLNIIHEALTNIREHSAATEVEIAVSVNETGVEAQVADNGQGFDPEPTLMRAARSGRLGLVAIHERVRLLGGQCRIDSHIGGPTVVWVGLERWEPLVNDAQPSRLTA